MLSLLHEPQHALPNILGSAAPALLLFSDLTQKPEESSDTCGKAQRHCMQPGTILSKPFDLQKRALDKKANKIEKMKNKKGGQAMWSEVHELGQLIRYACVPTNYLSSHPVLFS